jgi:FtsH-binding integral membrane protein
MTENDAGSSPTPATRDVESADRTWKLCTLAMLVVIWVAVVVVSVFAPDLVSGSEQERLPIAAFTTWLWGAIATAVVLLAMSRLRADPDAQSVWIGYTVTVVVVWIAATVLALTLPEFETGSDPTLLPFGAMFAPLAAAVLTGLAGVVAVIFARPPNASAA